MAYCERILIILQSGIKKLTYSERVCAVCRDATARQLGFFLERVVSLFSSFGPIFKSNFQTDSFDNRNNFSALNVIEPCRCRSMKILDICQQICVISIFEISVVSGRNQWTGKLRNPLHQFLCLKPTLGLFDLSKLSSQILSSGW